MKNKGAAIDEGDLARIFDSRVRGKNADRMDPHGKGLGLHITKNLVEGMGGTIEATSTDAHGTTFRIVMPKECNT